MKRLLPLLGLSLTILGAETPVLDPQVVKDWATSKQFTLAVAEAMPEEKYAFKPVPEEMPFASLMVHIAVAQAYRFSQIAGKPMPFEIPKTIDKAHPKDASKKLLTASFDYCMALLPEFTAEQMEKLYQVDWFERPKVTGKELVLGMFVHTAHHRGQAEVYLRLNGIKPPEYRF